MKTKSLVALSALTVFAGGIALYVVETRAPSTGAIGFGQRFLPDLATKVNDVAHLSLATREGKVTLEEQDGAWRVVEKSRYAANFERVKSFIIGLSELKTIEPKTDNPALFPEIGVEDIDAPNAASTLVTLKDRGGQPLATLLVGKTRQGRGSAGDDTLFVRKRGDNQSWLVEGQVSLVADPAQWIVSRVLELRRDRIASVAVNLADGKVLHIRRDQPGTPDFEIADLPPALTVTAQDQLNAIAGMLGPFDLDDVAPAAEMNFDIETARRGEFRTYDGLVVKMTLIPRDNFLWARFEAGFEPPASSVTVPILPVPAMPPMPGNPHGEGAAASAMKSPEEIQAEANEINARVGGWAYRLPDFRAELIEKKLEDFVGKVESGKPN